MAPVYQQLTRSDYLQPLLVSTGQHREMLLQILQVFDVEPDVDLAMMQPNQRLPELTGKMLPAISNWLAATNPAAVLVQGDTTTAFTAGLAAFYARMPLGHIEAGLRTYDFDAPWPEEMNRRLVDPISTWCFAPTAEAQANLLAERIPAERVYVTGNTVIDALLWVRKRINRCRPALPHGVAQAIDGRTVVLVTGHRRESFGAVFENICHAIRDVADDYSGVAFVYPVHLNPNVKEPVTRILGGHARIHLIPPLSYEPFTWLMDRAALVLTDSGGVQEEAPSLGKPVLVMRERTERPEGVAAGNARLVGVGRESISHALRRLLDHPSERLAMSEIRNPYGDGRAAARIVAVLETAFAPQPTLIPAGTVN